MPSTDDDKPSDDAAVVGEIMESPFGSGLAAAANGGVRSDNPHAVDGQDWGEWLRGFEAWETAPKVTVEIPDELARELGIDEP